MATEYYTPDIPDTLDKKVQEAPDTPDVPDTQKLSKNDAKGQAEEIIMSPKLKNSLSQIGVMEAMLKEGKLPPIVEAEYKNLKNKIKDELKNDSTFQDAMHQLGVSLDENRPIEEIGEPDAGDIALNIVGNPLTLKQIMAISDVLNGYNALKPEQQEALNNGLSKFTNDISAVFEKLVNPKGNNQEAA